MVDFLRVDPDDIPDEDTSMHRGRVSYPVTKHFLETGYPAAQVDRSDMAQSAKTLRSALRYFIRKHKLPISLVLYEDELYMKRLDMTKAGDIDPTWDANKYWAAQISEEEDSATPISRLEIARRRGSLVSESADG